MAKDTGSEVGDLVVVKNPAVYYRVLNMFWVRGFYKFDFDSDKEVTLQELTQKRVIIRLDWGNIILTKHDGAYKVIWEELYAHTVKV